MLEKLSIEWKLPAAVCGVLMAVVIALSIAGYREVAGSARRASTERVESFTTQLAGTLQGTVDDGLRRLGARASRAPLVELLADAQRTEPELEAARTALEALAGPPELAGDLAAIELRTLERERLLVLGPERERVAALAVDESLPPAPAESGVGALVDLGGRVVVPAAVAVVRDDEPLGHVVRWSYVTLSAETREQIAGFLASEAGAYLGSPGGLWIDWERIVPEPAPAASALGGATTVERPGGPRIAAAASVAGTPWLVVVEYPERLALAPARLFLRRIGAAASTLLLLGCAGVWLAARRLTAPLRELTDAAEALEGGAGGDDRTATSGDELARLRRGFQRMAERVHEAHRGLEAKVGELREARERERAARAAAEEASSRKDEFLAMLAHELRNPLSPILSALAVVRSPRAAEAARADSLGAIERQVRNMSRIVDDLLDVSRITRGAVVLDRGPTDVAGLLRNSLETVRPHLDAKRHHVSLDLPAEPLSVEVDPTRMEQVLANLLTNAAKYTEPGGHVHVSAAREDGEVVIRVRDDGIGIPPDRIERIFELFHQVDASLERSRGGLGIGLTLARKLAELHGGTLSASSAGAGRGSEFVVRLPAGARSAAPPDAGGDRRAAPPGAGRVLRVLVVDDAPDARRLLEALLALDGHEVATAEDGEAALARFRSFAPEAVVLDLGLPRLDGFEVARRIRAVAERPVLLVAATGYGDARTRARAREAGFDAHLVKPIEPAELLTLLARAQARRVPSVPPYPI